MHPLTTDLAEQILALVRIEAYSLLGAIQDGKTVLGGSAGSGGGAGEPPAGFVGQLTQSNVTFDTDGATRACSAGSAGSSSLVGNLDAIRLGIEICDDAILGRHISDDAVQDHHVDWGHGAGQVDSADVPFTSGSLSSTNVHDAIEELLGQGGIKTIGQVVSVGVSGCNYTSLEDARDYIVGLGDAAADKPYLIWMMAGEFNETASFTIPSHVTVVGQEEATIVDMGDHHIIQAADSELEKLDITGTGNDEWYVVYVTGNDAKQRNLRVTVTGSSNEAIFVHGCTGFEADHVKCYTDQNLAYGFYFDDAIGTLWDCEIDDTSHWAGGLFLDNNDGPSTVTTLFCQFRVRSAGDDVYVVSGSTWNQFACNFDPNNSTIDGTETPLTHGKTNVAGNLILPKTSGNGIKIDNTTPTFGWRDLRAEIRTRGVGSSDPNDTTYIGNIKAYTFSVGDESWVEFHIPHDYVAGTDTHLHFHWSHNSADVTGGSVTWGADVTYAKGHDQAAFAATVNPTLVANASTTRYQHLVSEVQLSASTPSATQIDTDDLEPDGIILARVYLSANNITSDNGVPDPFLHEVDIHYQSTNIATKSKAPDFYA